MERRPEDADMKTNQGLLGSTAAGRQHGSTPRRSSVPSPASDAVLEARHPSPNAGGPCATCAFRKGTEANETRHTMDLARLCVEGGRPFYCHEQPQLCRGFIAAINLRGPDETEGDKRWSEMNAMAADVLSLCIERARAAEEAQDAPPAAPAAQPSGGVMPRRKDQ